MVEIEISNPKSFRKCIDCILNLVKEGNFEINENGMELRAMDPSQISMVIFSANKDFFSRYDVKEKVKIGVDLDNFNKILSRWRSGEVILLKIENKKFEVIFKGNKSKRSFLISTIDVPSGPIKELKINYIAKIKMNGKEIKEIINDAGIVSPHIKFFVDSNLLRVEAYGENSNLIAEYENDENIKIETSSPTSAIFSQEYLFSIAKGCDDNSEIELNISGPTADDPRPKPLCMKYNIDQASFIYYLAPRIETE